MTSPSSAPAVLIVEDEWLIADMIEHALSHAGYRTLGPAASVAQALALMAAKPCDAALLDVNLGSEKSYAVLDRLIVLRVPHLLITGYSIGDLPERYRHCPCVGKPLVAESLVAALKSLAPVPRAG